MIEEVRVKNVSGKKRDIQIALSAGAVVAFVLIALSTLCLQAQANPGDDRYLSKFEEEYLKDTQLLQKEQTMTALEQGDNEGTDQRIGKTAKNRSETLPDKMMRPKNTSKSAPAESQAGQAAAANSAGEIARDTACMAIDYASRFMKNFTTEDGNRWNNYRNQIFVPIALLLILPGAVLTQMRAIIAQSNPVVGAASPLEGIQRGMIAVFLVPSSCLVTNYAIDLGNSLHYTVCQEYTRIIGGDMYRDAMCAEIRAFGTRALSENEGSLKVTTPDLSPRGSDPFAKIEGRIWGKISDPCSGLVLVPANRDDTVMPQSTIATRLGMFTANAGICAGWSMLTAFQMAFFYYLYFVGPIMAALWAWPTQMFKTAFPIWVESCVTLAFWSFLWQITIALLALTKSPDSTGLYMVTALNVLATTSVKHAFDCASIMKSAVQSCEQIGAEVASKAGSGGGGGGKGGGKGGKKGGSKKGGSNKTEGAPDKVADNPHTIPRPVTAPIQTAAITHDDEGNKLPSVPAILKATDKGPLPTAVVRTSMPPAARTVFNQLASNQFSPNALAPNQFSAAAPNQFIANSCTASFGENTLNSLASAANTATTLNSTSCVWNDPVRVSEPPAAPRNSAPMKRDSIGSVLGNAIQEIMVYPAGVPIQDPDLIYLDKVKEEITNQTNSLSSNNHNSPVFQETEMTSNQDSRFAAHREQRFSSASQTPQQLLSRLEVITQQSSHYPPPPLPVVTAAVPAAPLVSAVPACGFGRVATNQVFESQEATIVTVADFRNDLQGQTAPEPLKPNLNRALGSVLRQHGPWAQSQAPVKAPLAEAQASLWWS